MQQSLFNTKKEYQAYIKEDRELRFKHTKIGVFLLFILFSYGILLDYFTFIGHFWQLFVLHGIMNTLLLPIMFLLYKNIITEKNYILIDFIWIIFAIIPVSIMVYITGGSISPYYAGINIVIIGITQLFFYNFYQSIRFCLIILVGYTVAIFLQHDIPFNLASCYNSFHFIMLTCIISLTSCYLLTKNRIKEFKQRYQLEEAIIKLNETKDQLIQSEKMNSLGILAAGVMHEVNNSLSIISANTAIIMHQPISDKVRKSIERIENSGVKQITRITTDLRQFCNSKDDIGEVLLIELIEYAKSITIGETKWLNISLDIEPDTKVFVSKNELMMVFTNLLINSAYALKEVGRNMIKISSSKKDEMVYVKFWDNGTGIEKSKLKNVFDPFFTTKPTGVGLGLGLHTCYTIIKKHGGDLRVNSKKDEWTEFIFTLPESIKKTLA